MEKLLELNREVNDFFSRFKFKSWQIVLFLFLFSLILRLAFINEGLWHFDSVDLAKNAELTWQTKTLHYEHGMGFPGMVLLIAVFFGLHSLFGATSSYLSATLVSIFLGAGAVIFLYLFLKELTESEVWSFISSMLFSLAPLYVSVTTYAKSHGPSTFFVLGSLYFFIKYVRKNKLYLNLLAGFFLGYGMSIRITNGLYMAIMFLLYFDVKLYFKNFKISFNRVGFKKIFFDANWFLLPLLVVFFCLYIPKIKASGFDFFFRTAQEVKWLGFFSKMVPFLFKWITPSVTWAGWILCVAGIILVVIFERR